LNAEDIEETVDVLIVTTRRSKTEEAGQASERRLLKQSNATEKLLPESRAG
jgi:hypothetical protein